MPATTTTTELFAKTAYTLAQVQQQMDLRIRAGAIRSTVDQSDRENYILVTDWNVIGSNDDIALPDNTAGAGDGFSMAPGVGHALLSDEGTVSDEGFVSDENVRMLAAVLMSEASVGNNAERVSVGFTMLNRLKASGHSSVSQVWGAYAHNQSPTGALVELARQLLAGQRADITDGCTHFYSPRSMPRQGQPIGNFDVGGGLELVPPLAVKTYAPSWTKTMEFIDVFEVRPSYYKFYRPR
jgi:hypothetical protein